MAKVNTRAIKDKIKAARIELSENKTFSVVKSDKKIN